MSFESEKTATKDNDDPTFYEDRAALRELEGEATAPEDLAIIEELQKSGLIQDRLTALELQSGGRMGVAVVLVVILVVGLPSLRQIMGLAVPDLAVLAAVGLLAVLCAGWLVLARRVALTAPSLVDVVPR